jgi:glycosyltransferase involved in cell wall biosynthesis
MLLANLEGSIGGSQRQAGLLAHEVARCGLRVAVVNQSPRLLRRHGSIDDGVERVPLPVLGWCSRASFFLAFLLWATVNRRHFHVIHAHSTSAGLTAGLVGGLLRKPVVVKVTGMQAVAALADPRPAWRLRRWMLNRTAEVVVAVSTEMMHALSEAGIGARRRVLIPNGVRCTPGAAAPRTATRARWVGQATGAVVLYVGRIAEVKGVRRLLRMWSAMPRRDTATLLIVGDGPLRPELEREAAECGLDRSVRFLGSHADVTTFYRIADVFVLPSVTEGLSNALLEAMAAGLPVVASDVAGNREVIEDGVNGVLVDWADPGAAAGVVLRLLDDAELRRRVGEGARRCAGRFTIASVAERYCRLYQTVASPSIALSEAAR